MPQIAILIGSDTDLPVVQESEQILKKLEIDFETHIYSAHRTPEVLLTFLESAPKKGFKVIIAAAGMAAHLAGVTAAHTLLPVIGIPMEGKLDGLDSLLSTVQMPKGVPVATMAIGKTGAINAALFSAQILALSDETLMKKLRAYRQAMKKEVLEKDQWLQQKKS